MRRISAQGQNAIRMAVVVVVVLMAVLLILYGISRISGVTFMSLLKALALPITLGAAVPWLDWLQKKRELEVEKLQKKRELEVEDQRAQDEALQEYQKQMSRLLTDEMRPLHEMRWGDSLSTVAWAWTKTVLRRMGPRRKGHVLRFVNEAGLINKDREVFPLSNADLRCADLRGSVLRGISKVPDSLPGVNLSEANLSGADLCGADLTEANLRKANLRKANLRKANLRKADLSGADMSGADLAHVKGVTNEELDQQAASLEGATMPNGQKYEDRPKSKDQEQNK